MPRIIFIFIIFSIGFPAFQGCTTRAWYEGLQEAQRQECYREKNPGAVQQCLGHVNQMTYDQYQAEREKKTDRVTP